MRTTYLTAFAALSLLLAAPAGAKEIESVAICGASGCKEVDDAQAFVTSGGLDIGRPRPQGAPRAQPYFRVDVKISIPPQEREVEDSWSYYVLPKARLARSGGVGVGGGNEWTTLTAGSAERIARISADLTPFPSPQLTAVRIGSHKAPAPSAYTDLFGLKPAPKPATVSPGGWEQITLRSAVPGPWTHGGDRTHWSPTLGLIRVDGLYYRPGRALAARLARDSGRAAAPGDDGLPVVGLMLGGLGAALIGAAALVVVRRRRGGQLGPSAA